MQLDTRIGFSRWLNAPRLGVRFLAALFLLHTGQIQCPQHEGQTMRPALAAHSPLMRTASAAMVSLALAACAASPADAPSTAPLASPRAPAAAQGYTAVYLAPYPQPSGCTTQACALLDRMEREGYEAARTGVVSWRRFVEWYYAQRAKIYPDSDDSLEVNDMRKLQLELARQLDLNEITEREWVQRLEDKLAAIRAAR